ncbi:MAG: YraN family protein [Bacteroidota bacterium]
MAEHNELGKTGEDLAASFLEAKGYQILDRNYRFQRAEIDLVALRLDPAELVFVEVKTRRNTIHSYPEEAVTPEKRKKIFKVADSYIYEKQLSSVPVRFDIIAISMDQPEHPVFHHIEDAFRLDSFSLGDYPLGL